MVGANPKMDCTQYPPGSVTSNYVFAIETQKFNLYVQMYTKSTEILSPHGISIHTLIKRSWMNQENAYTVKNP